MAQWELGSVFLVDLVGDSVSLVHDISMDRL